MPRKTLGIARRYPDILSLQVQTLGCESGRRHFKEVQVLYVYILAEVLGWVLLFNDIPFVRWIGGFLIVACLVGIWRRTAASRSGG